MGYNSWAGVFSACVLASFRVRQCSRGCNTLVVRDRWEQKIRRYFILLLLLVIIIRGGQLVATERADGVAMEPLKDAVLVKDVGAGHGAEPCHHLYSSWVLLVLMICRISQSLRQMARSSSSVVVSRTSLSPRIALLEAGMRARLLIGLGAAIAAWIDGGGDGDRRCRDRVRGEVGLIRPCSSS